MALLDDLIRCAKSETRVAAPRCVWSSDVTSANRDCRIQSRAVQTIEGKHDATGLRIAIIASRFNDEIVEGLLRGAVECLQRHGAADEAITLYRVPGAFEIPTLARELAARFDAILAIGCLIRGETFHFDVLSMQVTNELSRIEGPIAFGVITCNTYEQAVARSSPGAGNKGWEAALAAIEMANLWRALRSREQ